MMAKFRSSDAPPPFGILKRAPANGAAAYILNPGFCKDHNLAKPLLLHSSLSSPSQLVCLCGHTGPTFYPGEEVNIKNRDKFQDNIFAGFVFDDNLSFTENNHYCCWISQIVEGIQIFIYVIKSGNPAYDYFQPVVLSNGGLPDLRSYAACRAEMCIDLLQHCECLEMIIVDRAIQLVPYLL
jgi:hypothetical protein